MKTWRLTTSAAAVVGAIMAVMTMSGCKPDYPACETDKDCKAKEFCVERKCQQCRQSTDCAEGFSCEGGKCAAIPGFCRSKAECAAGEECIGNRCRPCQADGECPAGLICVQGTCAKGQCTKDDDCAQDQECRNSRCVSAAPKAPPGPPCPLASVYFGFDQASLNAEATNVLSGNAACLKKANRPVNLVGHADPRGTTEYNLALSDRRAQAVRDYLSRIGIEVGRLRPVPRGALDATGTDEGTWSKDRRVDLEWQ
jgi:peptidoglycan-associated lipoprotein